MNKFSYIIDLNERGSFRCHVEDENCNTVWQADNEDPEENGEFWPVENGFMKNYRDMDGLRDYLMDMGVMGETDKLIYVG